MSQVKQDQYVAKEFNRQANRYDESLTVNSYQRRTQQLTIKEMQIERGMFILDLGCGTGSGSLDIASRLHETGKVIGLDVSEKMIEQANKKLAIASYQNVEFQLSSGHTLKYENEFDYILSTNAFHHFQNKGAIFSRVHRALKHHGIFIIQDICNDFLLMKLLDTSGKIGEKAHVGSTTSRELHELFTSAGFMEANIQTLKLNWFWGIMIGKGRKD